MKFIPFSTAVSAARMPSASRMEWKTPPSEDAPKLSTGSFNPVFPKYEYRIVLLFTDE